MLFGSIIFNIFVDRWWWIINKNIEPTTPRPKHYIFYYISCNNLMMKMMKVNSSLCDLASRMQLYVSKIQEIWEKHPCMSFCLIFIAYNIVKQCNTSNECNVFGIARVQRWQWFYTTVSLNASMCCLTSLKSLLGAATALSCSRYEAQHHAFFLPPYGTAASWETVTGVTAICCP